MKCQQMIFVSIDFPFYSEHYTLADKDERKKTGLQCCSSSKWKRNVLHFVDCGQLNVGFFS